jgi:hypothetical protein
MFNKPASALFNRSLSFVLALSVTKFVKSNVSILSHFVVLLKYGFSIQLKSSKQCLVILFIIK